jgi:hypothetical protein
VPGEDRLAREREREHVESRFDALDERLERIEATLRALADKD